MSACALSVGLVLFAVLSSAPSREVVGAIGGTAVAWRHPPQAGQDGTRILGTITELGGGVPKI